MIWGRCSSLPCFPLYRTQNTRLHGEIHSLRDLVSINELTVESRRFQWENVKSIRFGKQEDFTYCANLDIFFLQGGSEGSSYYSDTRLT